MKPGPLLAAERLSRFRALGVQGEPAWRFAGQLRAALIGRLGQEHADLLAVPQVDESGERIEWYAPFDGPVASPDRLSAPERTELDVRARRLQEDIENLAQQLSQSGRTDAERNFARLLRHALTVPSRAMLLSVAGRPVFAFWGFASEPTATMASVATPAAQAHSSMFPMDPPVPLAPGAPGGGAAVLSSSAAAAASGPRDVWKLALLAMILLLLLALGAWLIKPYLPVLLGLEEYGRQAAIAPPPEVLSDNPAVAARQTALARSRESSLRLAREFAALGGDLMRKQSNCTPGSIGSVIGPAGEIVGGDGRVIGRIVGDYDGRGAAVIGPDGQAIVGTDGKPEDPREVAERAAREKPEPGKGPGPGAQAGRLTPPADKPPAMPDKPPLGADKPPAPGQAARQPGQPQPPVTPDKPPATADKPPTAPGQAARQPGQPQPQPGKPPGAPGEKAEQPKIEKPLAVPPEARARGDVGFMQGDWRSRSTLTTQRGEEDIRVNYQFDDKGKGKSVIVQQNGITCEAPATARFDKDGKLVIEEQSNPRCSDGSGYVKSTVTCEMGKSDGADCVGRNEGGKTYSVQIGK